MKIYTIEEQPMSEFYHTNIGKDYQADTTFFDNDFWIDSDYLMLKGKVVSVVEIDKEIFINSYQELPKDVEELVKTFYDNDKKSDKEVELSTWPQDIKKSAKKMQEASVALKYRGGRGYHYGWWVLRA